MERERVRWRERESDGERERVRWRERESDGERESQMDREKLKVRVIVFVNEAD